MPIAITDEQLAIQASIREWAKRTQTTEIVRSMEPGRGGEAAGQDGAVPGAADQGGAVPGAAAESAAGAGRPVSAAAERWSSLAGLGIFSIGLPAASGEDGGGAAELAAALAQVTESLVPGPVMPTLLAGLVLARCQAAIRGPALAAIADGNMSVAAALEPGSVRAVGRADGTFALTGTTGPILCGGSTTHLLLAAAISGSNATGTSATDRSKADSSGSSATDNSGSHSSTADGVWFLLPADHPGVTLAGRLPVDFSRSLADVSLAEVIASPDSLLHGVTASQVRDLAAVLASVEAAAVASWCSRTAAEYAAIRQQFGRPIGSFQAVKHLCATMLCRAESAAVLAWDAARAIADEPDGLALAAAAAAAVCLDAAVDNAKDCIQVLGGIGFTWDHDAHLYLRRAMALRQLLGGSARWRDKAAALAVVGVRRRLTADDAVTPDSTAAGDELVAVRRAARTVATEIARLPPADQRRALADSGYAAPSWAAPYGLAASPAAALVIDAELAAAGLARPDILIGGWAVPAILGHGSEAQQVRFAGPTLRGEISWCQLFSEPEAGSDLASLRTRAERADGGWLLTGQKVWTSLAREADWAICLARTDATVPKHKGISYFLVAMDSPGIEIRPLREMTGREMFNQVFLDQVFVPDDCVVGAPGDGWRIARTTLASERVAMGAGSSVGESVERLLEQAADHSAAADPAFRQQLGALVAGGMAVSLLDLQAVLAQLRGADPGPLAAVRKLAGVAHRQSAAEAALELAGPDGAANDDASAGLVHEFLLTRCLSIAGGTTQILLSLVAERLLGLPREEAR